MCWDALIVTGAGTQEVAEFIMLSTKALRRVLILEVAHTSDASLGSAVILFEPVVQGGVRPVQNPPTQGRPNCPWIGAVPVVRHPVRREACGRLGRMEERLGRLHVPVLAEHGVGKVSLAIERPIQITPVAPDLRVCLVGIPAPAGSAPHAVTPLTQCVSHDGQHHIWTVS
jgi:hypothetical protein